MLRRRSGGQSCSRSTGEQQPLCSAGYRATPLRSRGFVSRETSARSAPFAVPRPVVVRARHRNLVSRETDQVRRPVVYSGNRRADVLKRSSCSRKNRTRRSPAAVARLKQQRLSRQGSESRQLVSRETPAPWPQGGQHRAFPRFPSKQPAGSHRRLVLRSCSTIMALSLLASSVRACAIPHPL